jgi:hypothetical protein
LKPCIKMKNDGQDHTFCGALRSKRGKKPGAAR